MIEWKEVVVPLAQLRPYERNPRRISKAAYEKLKDSIRDLGYHQRIIATSDFRVIGGHQRIKALQDLGERETKVLVPSQELSDDEFRRLMITDNLPFGTFDFEILASDFELQELIDWGFPEDWLTGVDFAQPEPEEPVSGGAGSLAEQFGVPPFSVLNAREGWWQERKAAWIALGIRSELGRGENALDMSAAMVGITDSEQRDALHSKRRAANATPSGSAMPPASLVNGKTVRGDGRGRKANAIPGGGKDAA